MAAAILPAVLFHDAGSRVMQSAATGSRAAKGGSPYGIERLDAAIDLAWTADQFTDEINTAPPRTKQR